MFRLKTPYQYQDPVFSSKVEFFPGKSTCLLRLQGQIGKIGMHLMPNRIMCRGHSHIGHSGRHPKTMNISVSTTPRIQFGQASICEE